MKNEFLLAFNEVLEEKQLPKEVILQAVESAMVSAYRRAVNASNAQHIEAKVDPDTGKVTIFAEKEVVDSAKDNRTEVDLSEAIKVNPQAELGMLVVVESTPKDFGRVAAQTARQVIQQRIRDAERNAQLDHYQKQLGEIVSGIVQAMNSQGLTIGMEMRAEGIMARKDMIPGERFRIHDRVRALVAEVKDSPRGPQIILSRTHRDFLRRLLENEVPEIFHGVVEIRSIAREPGERAKVAVYTAQSGIDPVGACVGMRGVRIQAIVRELHDEKIDVIEWNPDPTVFIAKAISPARVTGVYLVEKPGTGKTATVVVPEDQLSLAIGRDGQNARLAAKLTNWRIDIKSLSEATGDAVARVKDDPAYQDTLEKESDLIMQIEVMLAKKAEGRPLTPEEYETMARFVDRIEKRTAMQPQAAKASDKSIKEDNKDIPSIAFDTNILDTTLPEHVSNLLQEAGFYTVGELLVQMKNDADKVFRLQGVGPKAMTEINRLVESFIKPVESQAEVKTVVEEPEVSNVVSLPAEKDVKEASVEEAKPVDVVETPVVEVVEATQDEEAPVSEPELVEDDTPFDQLFKLKSDLEAPADFEEDDDSTDAGDKKGKDKKKKKKSVEVNYDPDTDRMLVRKKHKRGGGEWDWDL
ncbi:MAG: transcription termination factor NusA [Anaerolineae bacterium]|nr:transcription termination factor NusA [Anaerolineae bacterium]